MSAFASNYCPLQVKSSPSCVRQEGAAGPRAPGPLPGTGPTSLGIDSSPRGLDVFLQHGARSGTERCCSAALQPLFQPRPGEMKTEETRCRSEDTLFSCSPSPLLTVGNFPDKACPFPGSPLGARQDPSTNQGRAGASTRDPALPTLCRQLSHQMQLESLSLQLWVSWGPRLKGALYSRPPPAQRGQWQLSVMLLPRMVRHPLHNNAQNALP